MIRKKLSDTDLLDWLEKQEGCALISDDYGNWAVVRDGLQYIDVGSKPADIETAFYVEKKKWQKNVRAAIKAAVKEEERNENLYHRLDTILR